MLLEAAASGVLEGEGAQGVVGPEAKDARVVFWEGLECCVSSVDLSRGRKAAIHTERDI